MRFLVSKIGELFLTLIVVSIITFVLTEATGDPAVAILGTEATTESLQQLRSELGLDRPAPLRYFSYLGNIFRGDLGVSVRYHQPVTELIFERLLATLQLAGAAILFSLVFGVLAGVLAAVYQGGLIDSAIRAIATLGQAVPGFYLAILSIIIFGAWLNILPTGGSGSIAHLILPSATLGLYYLSLNARFVRSAMLEALGSDYVRTAKAKGLSGAMIIGKHALRNSLIGVATLVGIQIGNLLGGAVITETVFAWPGVGRLAIQAIYSRDYELVQGIILYSAAVYVFMNMLTDFAYRLIDPRASSKQVER